MDEYDLFTIRKVVVNEIEESLDIIRQHYRFGSDAAQFSWLMIYGQLKLYYAFLRRYHQFQEAERVNRLINGTGRIWGAIEDLRLSGGLGDLLDNPLHCPLCGSTDLVNMVHHHHCNRCITRFRVHTSPRPTAPIKEEY